MGVFLTKFWITNLGLTPKTKLRLQLNLPRKYKTELDCSLTSQNSTHLKNKEYYDRKAGAGPRKENDSCFILQPKTNHRGSKIPFRDYRWVGPTIVQKVIPNENYILRHLNTNKTQILHRIRLINYVWNQPLEERYREAKLQLDSKNIMTYTR